MNSTEFNNKYDKWLEERHYGLAIDHDEVIDFLDKIFQDLIKIEGFSYSQIKLKFSMARFYADGINGTTCRMIEREIERILEE